MRERGEITTMPFGKYQGWPFSQIPESYLEWTLGICKTDHLRKALLKELNRRDNIWNEKQYQKKQQQQHRKQEQQEKQREDNRRARARSKGCPSPATAEEIIKAGRRALSTKYHPDRDGGDGEKMKLVNSTSDWLLEKHKHD